MRQATASAMCQGVLTPLRRGHAGTRTSWQRCQVLWFQRRNTLARKGQECDVSHVEQRFNPKVCIPTSSKARSMRKPNFPWRNSKYCGQLVSAKGGHFTTKNTRITLGAHSTVVLLLASRRPRWAVKCQMSAIYRPPRMFNSKYVLLMWLTFCGHLALVEEETAKMTVGTQKSVKHTPNMLDVPCIHFDSLVRVQILDSAKNTPKGIRGSSEWRDLLSLFRYWLKELLPTTFETNRSETVCCRENCGTFQQISNSSLLPGVAVFWFCVLKHCLREVYSQVKIVPFVHCEPHCEVLFLLKINVILYDLLVSRKYGEKTIRLCRVKWEWNEQSDQERRLQSVHQLARRRADSTKICQIISLLAPDRELCFGDYVWQRYMQIVTTETFKYGWEPDLYGQCHSWRFRRTRVAKPETEPQCDQPHWCTLRHRRVLWMPLGPKFRCCARFNSRPWKHRSDVHSELLGCGHTERWRGGPCRQTGQPVLHPACSVDVFPAFSMYSDTLQETQHAAQAAPFTGWIQKPFREDATPLNGTEQEKKNMQNTWNISQPLNVTLLWTRINTVWFLEETPTQLNL